jgi:hypothetical protein
MKKWIIGLAAAGATTALTIYAVKKINRALEAFYEDPSEDLPEGVEGWSPTWRALLPPEVQKVIDDTLARFPDGFVKARPEPKGEGVTWEREPADQSST